MGFDDTASLSGTFQVGTLLPNYPTACEVLPGPLRPCRSVRVMLVGRLPPVWEEFASLAVTCDTI